MKNFMKNFFKGVGIIILACLVVVVFSFLIVLLRKESTVNVIGNYVFIWMVVMSCNFGTKVYEKEIKKDKNKSLERSVIGRFIGTSLFLAFPAAIIFFVLFLFIESISGSIGLDLGIWRIFISNEYLYSFARIIVGYMVYLSLDNRLNPKEKSIVGSGDAYHAGYNRVASQE